MNKKNSKPWIEVWSGWAGKERAPWLYEVQLVRGKIAWEPEDQQQECETEESVPQHWWSLGSTHRLAKMLPPTLILAGSFALSSASISRRTLGSTKSSMKTRWRWATAACPANMAAVIRQHNKATINNVSKPPTSPGSHATDSKRCNCRTKGNCLMDGNCHVQSVVYRATVETANCGRDYTGLTALTFKERFNGHQPVLDATPKPQEQHRPFEERLVSEGQKHWF